MIGSACPICGDFEREYESSGISSAYGKDALDAATFFRSGSAVVFVPVAPLVAGYLMVASLAHSPREAERASVLGTVHKLIRTYEDLTGEFAWAFEHLGQSREGASCVPHPHIHVLPGRPPADLVAELQHAELCQSLGWEQLIPADFPGVSIFTQNGEHRFRFPSRPKQFVRQHIARAASLTGEWDWRIFRHPSIFRETASLLAVIGPRAGFEVWI